MTNVHLSIILPLANAYFFAKPTLACLLQTHALISGMMMELYACGFNAWNQLRFDGTWKKSHMICGISKGA